MALATMAMPMHMVKHWLLVHVHRQACTAWWHTVVQKSVRISGDQILGAQIWHLKYLPNIATHLKFMLVAQSCQI